MTHPNTLLVITPLSGAYAFQLPPFAVRGITQTLEPIVGTGSGSAMGSLVRRTINAELLDLTNPIFRKYSTNITCKDFMAPALDNGWIGEIVEIQCACELSFPSGGAPLRPVVSGSLRDEEHFTFYRPVMTFMITAIRHSFVEWEAEYNWGLEGQEV